MKANDLRPGNGVKVDGKLYVVVKTEHTKPGKGPAYIQAKFKDVVSGSNIERRFGSADDVEEISLDRREMEYLYSDGSGATFMDLESYDQFIISPDILGDALLFLTPNASANVLCYEGNPVVLDLPASVELEITETTPSIKGATATNQLKEATCETGLKTRVPPFIEIGEKIRVATVDGSYQSRA